MIEIKSPYKSFFTSEAGKHYIHVLEGIIESNTHEAEKNPDKARDLTQQNAGIRKALQHIDITIR